jgi:DNA-binding SARP family transcriptional activator
VEFRILGPLDVLGAAGPIPVRGAKRRGVLGLLVVHAGQHVSVDRIVDALWGESAPPGAVRTVQTYVSQLRGVLDDPRVRVVARQGGYALEAPAECFDAARFEQLVRRAGQLLDPHEKIGLLDEALALWRGAPLEEFDDSAWAGPERARLEILRLQAVEQRMEAHLALGHHRELIGELEVLIEQHRLDERLWAKLVLAYYRSGRQADALRALQRLRASLADELGIEPSSELRALERRVLDQDATLDVDPAPGSEGAKETPALPSGVVTFLLTDVEGSTLLWDRSGEAMADALGRHDTILADTVRRHGGRLLKTKGEGDATFSVFRRATDAVVAAVQAQRALSAEAWPEGAALHVRMALVTGEAVEREGDYFGPTVNRAARVRSLAGGGEVLLAHATVEVVRDHVPEDVELVDVGSRHLKDLVRPERVWRVVRAGEGARGAGPAIGSEHVGVPLPHTLAAVASRPLVGRESELDRLGREVDCEGRHVVWVRGEPGIGKTHLVAESARVAHASGAIVLYGHCDEDLGAPYQPFVEALRHWSASVAPATLTAVAGRGLHDLGRLLPELADSSGLPTAGDAERYALFEAVDELLTNVAATAPVVLVVDDLHWADQSSLLLLRHLARSTRPARLTIIATYRDTDLDRTHPLAAALADRRRDRADTRIDVGALDPSQVTLVIGGIGVDLDAEAVATVAAEAEGNPFFVTEVARHFADASPGAATVPEGIREVVGRRLSQLSPEANQALTVAAVIGRDFDAAVVAAAGGPSGEALHAALEEAARVHVLDEVPATFGRYRFAHALIRQTLIAELSVNRRVRLHWAAGQALREHQPSDVAAIAHHLTEGVLAGDASTAVDACLTAGDTALAAAAWNEGAAHYQNAIDLLDQASVDEPEGRYRALIGLSDATRALLDFRRARQAYRDAATVARAQGWVQRFARAVIRGVSSPSIGPALAADLDLVDEALSAIGTGDSIERARLLALRAATPGQVGVSATAAEYQAALETAETGLAIAERVGDPATRLSARRYLTLVLAGGPNARRYLTIAKEMKEILDTALTSRSDADLWLLHAVAVALAGAAQQAGDADAVRDATALLEDLATRADTPIVHGGLLWLRLTKALAAGRLEEVAECTEALGAIAATDLRYGLVQWDFTTMSAFVAGDVDLAVERTTDALGDGAAASGLFRELYSNRAAFLAAQGDHDRACGELTRVLERGLPWDWSRQRALWSATEAAARLADTDAARTLHALLEPYDGTVLGGYAGWMIDGSAATSLGQLETVLGRYDEADAHFRAGLAIEERMGYTALAARSRLWWARMLPARDIDDDHAIAQQLLDDASVIAERCGLGLLSRDVAQASAM